MSARPTVDNKKLLKMPFFIRSQLTILYKTAGSRSGVQRASAVPRYSRACAAASGVIFFFLRSTGVGSPQCHVKAAVTAEDVGRDCARWGTSEKKNRFNNFFFLRVLYRRPRTIVKPSPPAGRLFLKTRPPPPVECRPPITVRLFLAG
ncbi:unnamed protein product [Aphis gossypii]|uniref:Uncharacterized protein n=1 Tax=Aphis gossypii TaxID=80765 RepID=A0A9P0JEU8_APHGO|nr:unnamed protein product [Aphis gossypii]